MFRNAISNLSDTSTIGEDHLLDERKNGNEDLVDGYASDSSPPTVHRTTNQITDTDAYSFDEISRKINFLKRRDNEDMRDRWNGKITEEDMNDMFVNYVIANCISPDEQQYSNEASSSRYIDNLLGRNYILHAQQYFVAFLPDLSK